MASEMEGVSESEEETEARDAGTEIERPEEKEKWRDR